MPYIEVGSRQIEVDEDGFLKNPQDWDEEVAEALAKNSRFGTPTELTDKHWEIIKYVRDFYLKESVDPPINMLEKKVGEIFGQKKVHYDFIEDLFPDGRVKGICRIAGLPERTGDR
ncbi:MAG: TusE/DsrC/DsvC family sulfur relay protein [Archaeoglobaceae archaeon]